MTRTVLGTGNLLGMVMAGQGFSDLETGPAVVFLGQGCVADLESCVLGRKTGTAKSGQRTRGPFLDVLNSP